MLSLVLVIFFLSTSVDCEVFVNGTTVCSNSIAVLECTTNTGVLRWNIPGGLSTTYNSPTDIGDIRDLDSQYTLNITSVTSMTVFTSTATTNNPVSSDQSLNCFDALFGGNSQTATITIKINVSPVINLEFTLSTSNCTEVTLSWDPPNDVPNCVTGYYIEYDGMLYSTRETSITVPLTNNTLNVYTVKATNGLMRNSTARSVSVNARGPSIESISFTHEDYNEPDNTADTLLEISWNFSVPERSFVDITRLLVYLNNVKIANTSINTMSWSTLVSENMTHTVTLVAYNCFGSSTGTSSVFVPPYNETDGTQNIGGYIAAGTAGGTVLICGVVAIIVIGIVVGHFIKKKNNEEKDNIELSGMTKT